MQANSSAIWQKINGIISNYHFNCNATVDLFSVRCTNRAPNAEHSRKDGTEAAQAQHRKTENVDDGDNNDDNDSYTNSRALLH